MGRVNNHNRDRELIKGGKGTNNGRSVKSPFFHPPTSLLAIKRRANLTLPLPAEAIPMS